MKWLYADISDFSEQEYKNAYENLSQKRKKKIDRLMRDEDKKRSLAAEILLYRLVKSEFSVENAVLENKENGRPFIKGIELYVSISHSHNMVACAAAYSPVGIDIEKIRAVNLKTAQHFCTEKEAIYLFGRPPAPADFENGGDSELMLRFYEVWTAKEAYFKMLGTGITDLKSVDTLSLKRELFKVDDYVIQIMCDE